MYCCRNCSSALAGVNMAAFCEQNLQGCSLRKVFANHNSVTQRFILFYFLLSEY